MVNKVILIGNMGKDPEVRHLEGGSVVSNFTMATNENYKDRNGEWQKITEWHNIVAWGGLAEYAEKWLKKGSMIFVEGKITTETYTDKDNIERRSTRIKALTIRMLDRRDSDMSTDSNSSSSMSSQSDDIPVNDEPEDDLPF